jgi:hypothetical protein
MAVLALIDQTIKDELQIGRVRAALYRWSVARLSNAQRINDQDGLAKNILRGNAQYLMTLARTMFALPSFPPAALADTPAGDTALQGQVDTLVPLLLSHRVLFTFDPDIES